MMDRFAHKPISPQVREFLNELGKFFAPAWELCEIHHLIFPGLVYSVTSLRYCLYRSVGRKYAAALEGWIVLIPQETQEDNVL